MDDLAQLETIAHAIAAAIQAKDAEKLAHYLAPDFVLRQPGANAVGAAEFIAAVCTLPVDVVFVHLEELAFDLTGDAALATGIQHSQVRLNGETIEERQPFIDWFVKNAGSWQLRVALDLSDE